ncbi:transmembrane emp24 domain-containing protein p24delta4-like [Olea europaea var. sylvestris]|uniref:transmembrane emp24 domain-containing protein p24delta4-like n=1 Tax=Olea europaea var. sylvestris TaxID=158386 RepID=UPI000C1D7B88|nr:transmembrane emp24 domain-containing protein p24delta4-like [Olea europaea var. sylvestris]
MGAVFNVLGWLMLIVLCVLRRSEAIWLNLPATGTKCVWEEIQNSVFVLADYVVISDDHVHPTPTISTKAFDLFTLRGKEEKVSGLKNNYLIIENLKAEMRTVSEATNAQVAWFSSGICIVVSIAQISYLKQYFHKKKLI